MNNLPKSIFVMVLGFAISDGQAQVCPPSIETIDVIRAMPPGWNSSPAVGTLTHTLLGVDIILGKPDRDDQGNDGILRPIDEPNGDYVWPFPNLVGDNEIWMRCIYSGSTARLEKRVDRTVRECRSAKSSLPKHKEQKTVSAICK